jgi:hypothetical protein
MVRDASVSSRRQLQRHAPRSRFRPKNVRANAGGACLRTMMRALHADPAFGDLLSGSPGTRRPFGCLSRAVQPSAAQH